MFKWCRWSQSQSRYVQTEVNDQEPKVLVVMVARDEAIIMITMSDRLAMQQRVEFTHHRVQPECAKPPANQE